jgi:hypothetical protein
MLMQTVDASDGALLIVHRVFPKNGYGHIHLGRLGSVAATCGINEKGLSLGSVSSYAESQDLDGLVCGTLIRACLQYCNCVDEAIELFRSNRLMFGGYTVNCLDISGRNAVIEITPDDIEIRQNTYSYMYNTKFETARMRAKNDAFGQDIWERRGYDRLYTFSNLMTNESKPYTIETLKRVMSDHSAKGPIWDWSTRLGAIMLPHSKSMDIFLGPPDCTSYETASLES